MNRSVLDRRSSAPFRALVIGCAFALGACGTADDESGVDARSAVPAATLDSDSLDALLAVGDSGRPAAGVPSDVLRRTAVEHAVRGVTTHVEALGAIGTDADPLLERAVAFAGGDERESGVFDDGPSSASRTLLDRTDGLDSGASAFLRAALGLDGEAARVTRDGDVLIVDPDDEALCAALEDASADAEDARVCRALAARLGVRLDASSADSGWLAVDLDGAETLRLGYGPVNSVVEVELGGVAAFARADAESRGEPATTAAASGRVRLTLGAPSRLAGRERATLALDVLTPLSITDGEGVRLDVAASRALELTADAASGRLDVAVGLGALSVAGPDAFSNAITAFRLAGLTANASLDTASDTLVVTGLGIGRGPMIGSVDGTETVRFELGDVGFRLDGATGTLSLHGDLAAALTLRQMIDGVSHTFSAVLSAPAGTIAAEHEEGFRVEAGRVDASIGVVGAEAAVDESLAVSAGQCAGSDPDAWDMFLPVVVPCR